MNVLVALEYRFLQDRNGVVYADNHYGYEFWQRYLKVFDGVVVLGRARLPEKAAPGWMPVAGHGVCFCAVPDFQGPLRYFRVRRQVKESVRLAVEGAQCFILRVPGTLGGLVERQLRRRALPYSVEVVGNPWDSLASGGVRSMLRPLARRRYDADLRRQCQNACAAAYVTAETLQERYPPGQDVFATHYSSVELPAEVFPDPAADRTRSEGERENACLRLIFVGSLAQLYKGPDVLLRALAECVAKGLDARLTILGDGRHRSELESLSRELCLGERVFFRGKIPSGRPVWEALRSSDLFVLPSRTEGLPRAMIEAMAVGLPCIGSRIGGIPELLEPDDMVPPGDIEALAQKIIAVCGARDRMAAMSRRNIRRAQAYRADILEERRTEFYRVVRDAH